MGPLLQYFLLFRGCAFSQVAVVQILVQGKGKVVPVRDKGEGIHTFAASVVDGWTNITPRPLYPRRKIRQLKGGLGGSQSASGDIGQEIGNRTTTHLLPSLYTYNTISHRQLKN